VAIVCHGVTPTVVLRSRDDRLVALECDKRCRATQLGQNVRWFDVVATPERVVAAFSGSGNRAQILIRRWKWGHAKQAGAVVTPVPCWAGGGGLCGVPHLASAGERLLLASREGTDMRIVESVDHGQTWSPMHGLRKAERREPQAKRTP
jgi:hypothetical protein